MDAESKTKQQKLEPPTHSGVSMTADHFPILPEDIEKVEVFSDSMKGRRKYKDVADAAQAAFESAAYAAAAARAAVELSRSESQDPDDDQQYNAKGFEHSKTEGSKQNITAVKFTRSLSGSSSDSADNIPKGNTLSPDVEVQTKEFANCNDSSLRRK